MKDHRIKDREWEHPKRDSKGYKKYWYSVRKQFSVLRKQMKEECDKKIWYEPYSRDYVKIVETGQLVKKENLEKFFGEETWKEIFLENI